MKAAYRKTGDPPRLTEQDRAEIVKARDTNGKSFEQIAAEYGVSLVTVRRAYDLETAFREGFIAGMEAARAG